MIRINLLPVKAAQKKEQLRNHFLVFFGSLLVSIIACYVLHASVQSEIEKVNNEISQNKAEIKKLEKAIGEVNKYKKLQEDLQKKLNVLADLKSSKSGPVHLMDDLINALPEKLWVTSFKDKGGALAISGVGMSENDVADFMSKLEASAYYQGLELKQTKQKIQDGLRLQIFDVSCRTEKPKLAEAAKP
ncbi:MAG: PilN domain-containing protein [Desulfuromonadaceae bacterium]|nr:PilN domain-containing protein [Desulfuromonadaceae bacterium]